MNTFRTTISNASAIERNRKDERGKKRKEVLTSIGCNSACVHQLRFSLHYTVDINGRELKFPRTLVFGSNSASRLSSTIFLF